MAEPNRRRTYLISPRFQWRFIGYTAAVSLLAISLLFLSNILFFRQMRQEALEAGLTPDNPYFDFLDEQKTSLYTMYFSVSGGVFVVMMGLGIRYSHRIAGPLHHLNNKMQTIANDGELSPVAFRRNDEFVELAGSFNAMVETLRKRA